MRLDFISLQSHGSTDIWTQGSDWDTNTQDNYLLNNEKLLIIALLLLPLNKMILQRPKELLSSTGFPFMHLSETAGKEEEQCGIQMIVLVFYLFIFLFILLQINLLVIFSVLLLFINEIYKNTQKIHLRIKLLIQFAI